MGSGSMYDNTPTSRFEEDMRAIIDGTPWPDRPPKSIMEILLKELYDSISDWKSKTKGAYVLHGSATLQTLPSDLTVDMVGWTYDMSEEFTTDSRFVEVGNKYPAGTNVSIANVGTDEIPVLKYDVMAAFVDVDAIYNAIDKVADMVADEFDSASAYSIGDIVWYEDTLYTFTSAHTAGSAWSSLEVTQTTVEEVLTAAISSINNALSDIEGMIGTEFNAANPYSKGDYVIYQDDLYKFTANHTAGAAWNSSIVTAIDLTSAIKAIEAALSAKQDTLPLLFSGNDITTNGNLTASGHVKDGLGNDMESLSALEATASGNPIVVNAQDVAAKELKVRIEPIQSGTGDPSPTNVRPISGRTEVNVGRTGKNLVNSTNMGHGVRDNTTGAIVSQSDTAASVTTPVPVAGGTDYVVSKNGVAAGSSATRIFFYDANNVFLSTVVQNPFTTPNDARFVAFQTGQGEGNLEYWQLEKGTTATPYEEYKGQTLTIALGQTVYGGDVDFNTGEVSSEKGLSTFTGASDENWIMTTNNRMYIALPNCYIGDNTWDAQRGKALTNIFDYNTNIYSQDVNGFFVSQGSLHVRVSGITTVADFKTWLASHNLQVSYELELIPITQLTPAQLELLKGYNYITGDGIIDLVYVPESISGLMEEVLVPISMLGTNESGNTKASRAYTSGEYFYKDQKMYKATTSIASGATFTVGTNCVQTTLFAELKAAQN